jgi:hypothetical protein
MSDKDLLAMSRQEMLSHFNDILRGRTTKQPAGSEDSGGSGARRGRSRTVRGDHPIENNEASSDKVMDTGEECIITKWIIQKSPPGEATSTPTLLGVCSYSGAVFCQVSRSPASWK